jgi:hypothetical protein
MRIAISSTYWPLIWPSPEPVTLTLTTGKSAVVLPIRPIPKNEQAPKFRAPESAPAASRTALAPGGRNRVIRTDLGKRETVVEITDSSGRNRYDEIDLVAEARSTERYTIVDDEPLSATAEVTWTWEFTRKDWQIRTETRTHVSCTKREFLVRARIEAYEGEKKVFERDFEERVKRNGN